ncbi:MAG TPA: metal ABC transporter permease [Galbitalea sp.]|jgi:zinc/manganese transport system permease protein
MTNTWITASVVAVIAGAVGFFVVLRGASFLAHALPHGAFAGAAGATLIGVDPVLGMGVVAVGGALAITTLGRRGRNDVVIALSLVVMLAFGALFLSLGGEYSSQVFSLLFGQILGVSSVEVIPIVLLGVVCAIALGVVYRPLLLSSVLPDMAAARGISGYGMSIYFALIVAVATAVSVPVVGALLMFSLMVGPPAAARLFFADPLRAIPLSIGFALVTVWASVAAAYLTSLPVGFFVTVASAVLYGLGRGWFVLRARRVVAA